MNATKKHQKRLKREKELAKRKIKSEVSHERKQYKLEYPKIIIQASETADPRFIHLIEESIQNFNFNDKTRFSESDREFYHMVKTVGGQRLQRTLNHEKSVYHSLKLGETIFQKIPDEKLKPFLPFNDMQITAPENDVIIHVDGLKREYSSFGTIYYSKYEPTLSYENKNLKIGYHKHAILRACDRVFPHWYTYGGLGDAYNQFARCIHFEPIEINGQPGFTLYGACDKGFSTYKYVEQLVGNDAIEGNWYYRIGYCPCGYEKDFLVAKTLYFPGFKGTPEYKAIQKSKLPSSVKHQILSKSENDSLNQESFSSDDFWDRLKLYQSLGVPQVKRLAEPAFQE